MNIFTYLYTTTHGAALNLNTLNNKVLEITKTIFSYCIAEVSGGVIFINQSEGSIITPSLIGCIFIQNSSPHGSDISIWVSNRVKEEFVVSKPAL